MKPISAIETRLFIHGNFVSSASGRTFPVVSPATNGVVAHVFEADQHDVDRAVQSAKEAFHSWSCVDGMGKNDS